MQCATMWCKTTQYNIGLLQEVMTHRVPKGPLQKEAPLAEVGDAVAVVLAGITAGRKKQRSCSNLHRQVL